MLSALLSRVELNFFNVFAILLEFSITRSGGTKRIDNIYFFSFSAFFSGIAPRWRRGWEALVVYTDPSGVPSFVSLGGDRVNVNNVVSGLRQKGTHTQ